MLLILILADTYILWILTDGFLNIYFALVFLWSGIIFSLGDFDDD